MDSADSDPAIVELARGFYALMNLGGSYPPMDSVDSDSAITNLVDEFRTRMNLDGTDSPMDSADVDLVLSFMPSDLIDDISIPPEGSDTSCTPTNDTLVHAKGNDTDTSKSYEEWESDFRDILKDHPIVDSKGPRTICTLVCNSEKYFKIDWFPDYLSFKDIRSNTSKELAMIYRLSGDYLFQFPETGQYLAMDEWLLPTVSEGCKFEFLDKTYYWKTHETSIKLVEEGDETVLATFGIDNGVLEIRKRMDQSLLPPCIVWATRFYLGDKSPFPNAFPIDPYQLA